jgi:hypothetical protein
MIVEPLPPEVAPDGDSGLPVGLGLLPLLVPGLLLALHENCCSVFAYVPGSSCLYGL